MPTELIDLLEKAESYLPKQKIRLIQRAYRFAEEKHSGQTRLTGAPYIEHPIETALYLADLRQDAPTLAAALLHDVIEDCNVSRYEIQRRFGQEVARLVDGVTKLARIEMLAAGSNEALTAEEGNLRAESIRKMLVAMAEDIRVVLIKLGDRLHNMRTLQGHPPHRRKGISQETLDIYAPLAHRLGMWDVKWQLEDLAFQHVNGEAYRQVSRLVATGGPARENYIVEKSMILKNALENQGIGAEVQGRAKNIYSIYGKMQKYAAQGKEFDKIYDLFAIRVLVGTTEECYRALGNVHHLWRPIPGQFDDYIANPKENMYQSLHTAVMCEGGTPLEVQIRTFQMHRVAEYGVAAHWGYKEGKQRDSRFEEKMSWLRQLLEWQREMAGTEEFLESVKTDIFQDQVFVYTPKGDVKELPKGSSPIDFAYRIHTELGHGCVGAKINGRLAPLDTILENGDTVEIVSAKLARGPSLDWLNPSLRYVQTASAKQRIRQWFRRQERSANIERGRELLKKALRRLGINVTADKVAELLCYESAEDLWVALGSSDLSEVQLESELIDKQPGEIPMKLPNMVSQGLIPVVQVFGIGALLPRMATCCNPSPENEIIGYITRDRGVTVHSSDCDNVLAEDDSERLVPVSWGPYRNLRPIKIEVSALDRVGLLRDVTTLVSGEEVNIVSVISTVHPDGIAVVTLTLYTTGMDQVNRVFNKLEGISGILNVTRANDV